MVLGAWAAEMQCERGSDVSTWKPWCIVVDAGGPAEPPVQMIDGISDFIRHQVWSDMLEDNLCAIELKAEIAIPLVNK